SPVNGAAHGVQVGHADRGRRAGAVTTSEQGASRGTTVVGPHRKPRPSTVKCSGHDAGPRCDPALATGTSAVLFKVELSLKGVVDRLDGLADGPQEGSAWS